ncbi:DNA repair protein RecO [Halalkalibacter akibai]|uniref:DNA repair protein RecO n=1 Tax=Halalkalibacter akibai (strain ATCC 43226 / DSM 21942 / CIP 109018 / JCM 9157 / 1139) TaxID=1236973 RepID=W4QPY9_HALA3|nr:DNA repair protein RecO [Halalkalibacter akibai]GAE33404.1 DNA recombination and repair protein RecO [Halalkalibacter akibai JCM 9157]
MIQKVEGIVIRTTDYGESNKIVTLFTRELGKLGVMSRGAKKPKNRLSAASQLFMYGTFVFQKSTGLGTLNQADITHSFREVRNDLFRASYATYIVELTDKLTEDRQRNPHLFELLYQTLYYLDEGIDPEVLLRIYELKMLAIAGIKPELDQCVSCSSTEVPTAFSIKHAGFLCQNCLHKDERAFVVSAQVARLLRLFYYFDLNRMGQISLKKETKKELQQIVTAYYDEYSGLRLKSRRFLEQMERMGNFE